LNPDLKRDPWTSEEDEALKNAVKKLGHNWSQIAKSLPGRSGHQCRERWRHFLNPNLKHGSWTLAEDEKLKNAVEKFGTHNWSKIAEDVPSRSDLQCKRRWFRPLNPDLNHEPRTPAEDDLLLNPQLDDFPSDFFAPSSDENDLPTESFSPRPPSGRWDNPLSDFDLDNPFDPWAPMMWDNNQ
jgi:hypothetical protein